VNDFQFKAIIRMAQQIVERSKDLDDAKKALKEILNDKDNNNES